MDFFLKIKLQPEMVTGLGVVGPGESWDWRENGFKDYSQLHAKYIFGKFLN